ncbi:MAG TPA: DUF2721 domain-containing protein [Caldimonas sp.]|jgi:hypothetical protein|nr:DUF2721 domain-containing protein [Caldimonas sp.]
MPETSPFAVLGFIAGPALLTNATTVLLLGTINRYARALDRARALAQQLGQAAPGQAGRERLVRQLDAAQRRVLYMVRSLTMCYVAIGCFGLGTLSFLLGTSLLERIGGVHAATVLMFATTAIGVLALILGTIGLAWESTLSYRILREEAAAVKASY